MSKVTANQEGPWYAFCHEYATTEFDHGVDPSQQMGISGHHVPKEADEGTVEITRTIPFAGPTGHETETFSVKKHLVGDLTTCVPDGQKLGVVISLVPDPNATQMPLEFDRDIHAIQEAAAAQHYNYTRFGFPGAVPIGPRRNRQIPKLRSEDEKSRGSSVFIKMIATAQSVGGGSSFCSWGKLQPLELTGFNSRMRSIIANNSERRTTSFLRTRTI